MVSSCHVLALLLCIGSVQDAQALLLKAAPAVIAAPAPTSSSTRKLTQEETRFLLDELVEKMSIPENKAVMVAAGGHGKGAAMAAVPMMHHAMTKLGLRDDEIFEVFSQAHALAEADPILDQKFKAYSTILKGAPLSLLFHAKAMVIKAPPVRQLTMTEAEDLLDLLVATMRMPENQVKMAALAAEAADNSKAKRGPKFYTSFNPSEAAWQFTGPCFRQFGFKDDQGLEAWWAQLIAYGAKDALIELKVKQLEALVDGQA